jgi:hypothetical protein
MKYDDLNNSYSDIKDYASYVGYIMLLIVVIFVLSCVGRCTDEEIIKEATKQAISEYEQSSTTQEGTNGI